MEENDVKVYLDDEDLFPVKEGQKLIIKFGPTFKKAHASDEDSDPEFKIFEDEEEECLPTPTKRRKAQRPPVVIRQPEDITEEELNMVAECVRDKKYNAEVVCQRSLTKKSYVQRSSRLLPL